MLWWGFWVLAALADPAPSRLVFGLALAAAILLILAVRLPSPASASVSGAVAFARRARVSAPPRLIDPDAAGRPRPRAPSVCPAAC